MIKKAHQHISKVISFCISSKFTLLLTAEIIFSVMISLAALFVFIKLGDDIFQKEIISIDSSWTQYLYSLRTPMLNSFMLFITNFGSPLVLLVGSIIFVMYTFTKSKKDSLIFSAILYSGIILNFLLKNMFHRLRPTILPLVHETGYSFPSGHAMNSFVFYAAIAYFYLHLNRKFKNSIFISIICGCIILLIGISRIYLGAHFPSDVIAGYMAGFFWLTSAILFEKTLIFRHLYKKANK